MTVSKQTPVAAGRPDDTVEGADQAIHASGSAFVMDPWTMARGEAIGYADGMHFYFAGRGGVLGDVDADVVAAAMGWFHSGLVRSMWEPGVSVAGARGAATQFFNACAEWGRRHLVGLDGTRRFTALAERVLDATDICGLPLFAGWRAQPRTDDDSGRAMQLVHVLREWRGGVHLIATIAAGLSPVEAVVANDGVDQAVIFGWPEPPAPSADLTTRHSESLSATDRLCASVYERALTEEERREFATLATAIRDSVTA